MKVKQTDVAVIGAGTAGLAAYRAAKQQTDKVLLIEGGSHGTTCARVGCMPSKLLIAAAEAVDFHRHTAVFGVDYDAPKIREQDLLGRVRRERDRFVGFVKESVDHFPDEDKINGFARFLDNHRLQVGENLVIEAKSVVIATGSSPSILPMFSAVRSRVLTSDDLFELPALPKKVAVFGPGVIGLELGQALHKLGVIVKMFGVGGALGPLQDPVVKKYAIKTFSDQFYLDVDAQVNSLTLNKDKVDIRYVNLEGKEVCEQFDYVLAATGRRPNIEQLDLRKTTLVLDEKGIPAFDPFTLQIAGSSIFIAGDANNSIPLLHEAADEGRIAGGNAATFPDVKAGLRRANIGVVFSDPQMASIGLNLEQVKRRCDICYDIGAVSFEDQGRSRVMGVNKGMLRVYGEQGTGLFLGAEMIGPAAEHIAHLLSWAVQARMTVADILAMPFYHPVIEEGVRTALRDLNHKLKIGPQAIERCLDCGPGG